jgi:hypothetical protein
VWGCSQRAIPLDSARSGFVLDLVIVSFRPSVAPLISPCLPDVLVSSRLTLEEVHSLNTKPVVLKALLQQRHMQTHSAFCREYDKVAVDVDRTLEGWLAEQGTVLPMAFW